MSKASRSKNKINKQLATYDADEVELSEVSHPYGSEEIIGSGGSFDQTQSNLLQGNKIAPGEQ